MRSIALKLWLGMMGLVAVVLLLLWLFQIVFLNQFYTQMRISEIRNSSVEILKEFGNKQQFTKKLDELAYNNNLTAELLDLEHNTIYNAGSTGTNGQAPMMRNNIRIEAYENVLQGETVLIPMTHPRFNSQYMLIGLPVSVSGKLQGALMITLPLAPVEATANILERQLLYITVILLGATLILTYFLSKSFTKPILEITKVSLEMASGNLAARSKTGRKDEIGRLAETINHLGKELSKIDQLRKDLIANVSHELRTPLSLIKGYAETIRDISGNNPEKRAKQVEIIIEEADRLSSIVEDILKLSQMQAGYVALNSKRFKLNETLDRVVKRYEILSEGTGVRLYQKTTDEAFVFGDETKIEQVLYNLINNAFNHSLAGDTITVNTFESNDKIRIKIADTGEGIPADELAQIWDRFYKGDKSGKRKMAGTGLGLAIVKNILTAHQTDFGVESRAGIGTTFWFELNKA
ncbi:MAG: ATP-binding protein [Carboxydocellales bacterium]